MSDASYIVIATLGSSHGVKGWLKVTSHAQSLEAILSYQPWYFKNKDVYTLVPLEQHILRNKQLIIKLKDVDDRETAREITGKKIYITRDQLPELSEQEYYWTDLENMTVLLVDGTTIGQVDYLFHTGSNDVLVVKGEKRHLIPFVLNDIVKNVDLKNREITVDWDTDF